MNVTADDSSSPYLTVAQAAEWTQHSPRQVRRWISSGRLRRYGPGTKMLVLRADVEALVARHGEGDEGA